jgi:hypothetical protein
MHEPGDVSGSGEGAGEIGTLDDHSLWDQVPEDKREYVKAKITDIIKDAVNEQRLDCENYFDRG